MIFSQFCFLFLFFFPSQPKFCKLSSLKETAILLHVYFHTKCQQSSLNVIFHCISSYSSQIKAAVALPYMPYKMFSQIAQFRECLWTMTTLKRFFPCMCPHVLVQVRLPTESFATYRTHIVPNITIGWSSGIQQGYKNRKDNNHFFISYT